MPTHARLHKYAHDLYLRLLEAPGSLTDAELLEMLLHMRRVPAAMRVASELLQRFGSIGGLLAADVGRQLEVAGMTEPAVILLKAAREIGVRASRDVLAAGPVFAAAPAIVDLCRALLAHEATERVHVLFLDTKRRLIRAEEVARGSTDYAAVRPRDIVKRALDLYATGLILTHNHPSGDPTPSRCDIEMTSDVRRAAALMEITVWDHIIVGKFGHISMKEANLL